jgi:murein L,D-transpeptidase YcbB/YkuD
MKGKIRRIISIALLVCFIASISATAVSAYSFTLQSKAYQSSDRLKDIARGVESQDLYWGTNDYALKLVQSTLYCKGYYNIYPHPYWEIDGIYGQHTYTAVTNYQSNYYGLKTDGIVGPRTLEKLDIDQKRLERNTYPY